MRPSTMLKNDAYGVLCKLNIDKVYDRVNWNFLVFVLKMMDFGQKWIRLIKWCISTTKFFVLVDDTPFGFFFKALRA